MRLVSSAAFNIRRVEVRDELAAHKLHIAESYVSKQGLREAAERQP
jgi:hypothetical protein